MASIHHPPDDVHHVPGKALSNLWRLLFAGAVTDNTLLWNKFASCAAQKEFNNINPLLPSNYKFIIAKSFKMLAANNLKVRGTPTPPPGQLTLPLR